YAKELLTDPDVIFFKQKTAYEIQGYHHQADELHGLLKQVRGAFAFCHDASLNLMGSTNRTRTGRPPCFPGFHLGIALITRAASWSHSWSMPLMTCTSAMLPSRSTTKLR